MTDYVVSSGVTSSGLVISKSDQLVVEGGGVATSTTVNSGGYELVLSGGSSSDNTIGFEGQVVVSSGGELAASVLLSGGRADVLRGGDFQGAVASSGGIVSIHSGGELASSVVLSGGSAVITDDVTIVNLAVSDGGNVVERRVIISGGEVFAPPSSVASSTETFGGITLSSGADFATVTVQVDSGGMLSLSRGTIISSLDVFSGGLVRGAGILKDLVHVAGVISGATLNHAGLLLSSGGALAGVILKGGKGDLYGLSQDLILTETAREVLYGSAVGVTVESGATLSFDLNGESFASGVTVRAGGFMNSGAGAVENLKLTSGGNAAIDAAVSGTIIYAGGQARLISGAHDIDIRGGGVASVYQPGAAVVSSVTVESGATLLLFNNASVDDLVIRPGGQMFHDYILNSGRLGSAVIASGAYLANSGGVATASLVTSGGVIYDQGRQTRTTVSAGGEEIVYGSGSEMDARIVGVASDSPSSSQVGALVALQIVSAAADDTVVSSGGYQKLAYVASTASSLESGGVASKTTVLDGGVVEVDSRGALHGASFASGAELLIYNRYAAIDGLSLQAGAEIALGDQSATAASIVSGRLVVSSGGYVIETFTLNGATSGLGVTVSAETDGQTLLTITSGGASSAASIVQAAARFGGSAEALAPSSAWANAARGMEIAATAPGVPRHALA